VALGRNLTRLPWLAFLLAGPVKADTPTRCEAIWIGPVKGCGLTGEWAATGSGSGDKEARKRAIARLVTAVRASSEVDVVERPMGGTDPVQCAAKAESAARLTCFPEPVLAAKTHCYIDLPVEGCGGIAMFELKGIGWRVSEKGRERMCKEVDKAMARADTVTREKCRSRCAQEARVRCPRQ